MEENKNVVVNENTEKVTETVNGAIQLGKPETGKPSALEVGILSCAALGVVETTGLIIYISKKMYDKWKENKEAQKASEKAKKEAENAQKVQEAAETSKDEETTTEN